MSAWRQRRAVSMSASPFAKSHLSIVGPPVEHIMLIPFQ